MHIQISNLLACIRVLLIWIVFWSTSLYLLLISPYFFSFDNPRLNYSIFMLLALLAPISLLWLSRRINGFWYGVLALISILSLLPIALAALFAYPSTDKNGIDPSFEKIAELKNNNNYYRLYRTNGGATTSFGLVLRKETPLFFGLKFVHRMKGYSPASKGKLEKKTPESARLVVMPNGFGKGEQIYDIKLH